MKIAFVYNFWIRNCETMINKNWSFNVILLFLQKKIKNWCNFPIFIQNKISYILIVCIKQKFSELNEKVSLMLRAYNNNKKK